MKYISAWFLALYEYDIGIIYELFWSRAVLTAPSITLLNACQIKKNAALGALGFFLLSGKELFVFTHYF